MSEAHRPAECASATCPRSGNNYQILVAKRQDADGSNVISGKHVARLETDPSSRFGLRSLRRGAPHRSHHAYIRNRPGGSAMVLDHNRAMANTVFIGLRLRRVPRAGDRGF